MTGSDAPEKAALLLWEVTADAAAITDVRDHRTYATSAQVLTPGNATWRVEE